MLRFICRRVVISFKGLSIPSSARWSLELAPDDLTAAVLSDHASTFEGLTRLVSQGPLIVLNITRAVHLSSLAVHYSGLHRLHLPPLDNLRTLSLIGCRNATLAEFGIVTPSSGFLLRNLSVASCPRLTLEELPHIRWLPRGGLFITNCPSVKQSTLSPLRLAAGASLQLDTLPTLVLLNVSAPYLAEFDLVRLNNLVSVHLTAAAVDTFSVSGPMLMHVRTSLSEANTLRIINAPMLAFMVGFRKLRGVSGKMDLWDLNALATLDGLENLEYVGFLSLRCPRLRDISAASKLHVAVFQGPASDVLCCPDNSFFATTSFTQYNLRCRDCFEFGTMLPDGVAESGVTLRIPYRGPCAHSSILVQFGDGTDLIQCPRPLDSSRVFACRSPPLFDSRGLIAVAAFVRGHSYSLTSVSVVPWREYAADLLSIRPTLPVNAAGSLFVEAPGIPDSDNDRRFSDSVLLRLAVAMVCTLGVLLCCALVFYCCCPARLLQLRLCDFLGTPFRESVMLSDSRSGVAQYEVKTSVGGLIFICTCVVLIFGLVASLVQALVDNRVATVSLAPAVSTVRPFATDFRCSADLFGYRGQCIDNEMALNATGLSQTGSFSLSFAAKAVCRVDFACLGCHLTQPAADISISVLDANAAASGFVFSCSSIAYDRSPSVVRGTIVCEDVGSFFKGAPATTAVLTATAAEFTEFDRDARSGVLMKFNSVSRGQQLRNSTFGDSVGCGFRIQIIANPAVLQVRLLAAILLTRCVSRQVIVAMRQSPLAIASQLLGLITGVFALARLLLASIQRVSTSSSASAAAKARQFGRVNSELGQVSSERLLD